MTDTVKDPTRATYTLDAANLDNLKARIAKIARKAVKLGCAPIVLAIVASYVVRRTFTRDDGSTFVRSIAVVDVTIDGSAPMVNGYELVATIEHTSAGNILRTVPTSDLAPGALVAWRTAGADCDHCGHRRQRNDTFLVRDVESGVIRQIGRTCLRDYMGGVDPHVAVALADSYVRCIVACEDEREANYSGGRVDGGDLAEYLVYVAASIRLHGWVSKRQANERGTLATAVDALGALWDFKGDHPNGRPVAADVTMASEALAYVSADLESKANGLNDYQHNLSVIIAGGSVTERQSGFAASIVAYAIRGRERAVADKLQAEQAGASEHVGAPKQRLAFRATVERMSHFEGRYGLTHILKFRDSKGNALTWFASRKQECDVGDLVTLTGTVKKHDEYRGEKQTTLTRCKLAPAS